MRHHVVGMASGKTKGTITQGRTQPKEKSKQKDQGQGNPRTSIIKGIHRGPHKGSPQREAMGNSPTQYHIMRIGKYTGTSRQRWGMRHFKRRIKS